MRLIDHIAEADPSSVLWWASGLEVRRGQLLDHIALKRTELNPSISSRVALRVMDPGGLLLSLVFYDGLVDQILIIPGNISEELTESFVRQAGCNELIYCGAGTPPQGWSKSISLENLLSGSSGPGVREYRRTTDTRWIIPTSGTTGIPKLVGHTLGSLTRSLKTNKAQGAKLTWGLLYEPSRFAGLQVFLQALCGGSGLVVPDDANDLERLPEELSAGRCNGLSATPSMWRRLLMATGIERLALKIISLGGEIADQSVLSALASRFPDARLTHIYASTEAGVGFSVKDRKAGFPESYLSCPPAGVQLKVDEGGYLFVKPDHLSQAYIGAKKAMTDEEGWINTGDLVDRRGSRYFFKGRANGAINVGGRKVLPQEVEEVILSVGGVALARVFGRRSSILGNLVEAQVLPHEGAEPTSLKAAVNKACVDRLEDYKRPIMVRVVDKVETTPSGKIVRV